MDQKEGLSFGRYVSISCSYAEILKSHSFLQSDTVSLKSAKSERVLNIHRDLLASKSQTIISAFENGFKESKTGIYEFKDTSEETLAYFIQWAYTGDYPPLIYAPGVGVINTSLPGCEQVNVNSESKLECQTYNGYLSHPLPTHLALYIFCSIYLVRDLKSIVFQRVTAAIKQLDEPWMPCSRRILTAVLRHVFLFLLADDPVIDVLVQFAAYRIAELRQDDGFLELIRDLPAFEARLLGLLTGPKLPPWPLDPTANPPSVTTIQTGLMSVRTSLPSTTDNN